jgi:hypothetical protein
MAKHKNEKAPDAGTSEAQRATRKNKHGNANKNKTQSVTARRLAMLANGYPPLPAKGKAVHLPGWTNLVVTAEMIQVWPQHKKWGSYTNTGILTRDTPALDIDIKDETLADDLEAFTRGYFNGAGRLLRRIGEWPKRALLFRTDVPFPKMSAKFIAPGRKFIDPKTGKDHVHKLEILCDGEQLIADGIHPDTLKPYTWNDHTPWEVPAAELMLLTEDQARRWLKAATELLVARGWQHVSERQTPDDDFTKDSEPLIVQIAVKLWGNYKRTNIQGEYRFGTHGSKSVDAITRTWFDFEDNVGGGIRDLMKLASSTKEAKPITASAYDFPPEETLARYDWLYGKHLLRGEVAGTAATGGTGKSNLSIIEALEMASGKRLLHHVPRQPLRVVLINLEDKRNTLDKRIAAIMRHYGLTKADLADRLVVLAKGEIKVKVARQLRSGDVAREEETIKSLTAFMVEKQADVLSVDSFVRTHAVNENDNSAIQAVVECFEDIAGAANCTVHLWHHTRKLGGDKASVEAARGAQAFIDACRSIRILETMSRKERDELRSVMPDISEPGYYFRAFNGKRNFAEPTDQSDWFKFISIKLRNYTSEFEDDGDNIGVITLWQYPRVELPLINEAARTVALAAIKAGGPWRANPRSTKEPWVGVAIATALCVDLLDLRIKNLIHKLVKEWLAAGLLKLVKRPDQHGDDREYVEVTRG